MELRGCPKLFLLDVQEKNVNPLVRVFPKIASLVEVRLREAVLSAEQIKLITSSPHIERLRLQKKHYSAEDMELHRRNDPKVSFEDY